MISASCVCTKHIYSELGSFALLAAANIEWFRHVMKKNKSQSVDFNVVYLVFDATNRAMASVRQPCLVPFEGALLQCPTRIKPCPHLSLGMGRAEPYNMSSESQ